MDWCTTVMCGFRPVLAGFCSLQKHLQCQKKKDSMGIQNPLKIGLYAGRKELRRVNVVGKRASVLRLIIYWLAETLSCLYTLLLSNEEMNGILSLLPITRSFDAALHCLFSVQVYLPKRLLHCSLGRAQVPASSPGTQLTGRGLGVQVQDKRQRWVTYMVFAYDLTYISTVLGSSVLLG